MLPTDRKLVASLLSGCGQADEVADEAAIDLFTALTGPVSGFVAYFADCMVNYAVNQGIEPRVAERAVRQLFRASGTALYQSGAPPRQHVREMIEYAGTTAAGLEAMRDSDMTECIAKGLDAARAKAQSIARRE